MTAFAELDAQNPAQFLDFARRLQGQIGTPPFEQSEHFGFAMHEFLKKEPPSRADAAHRALLAATREPIPGRLLSEKAISMSPTSRFVSFNKLP